MRIEAVQLVKVKTTLETEAHDDIIIDNWLIANNLLNEEHIERMLKLLRKRNGRLWVKAFNRDMELCRIRDLMKRT